MTRPVTVVECNNARYAERVVENILRHTVSEIIAAADDYDKGALAKRLLLSAAERVADIAAQYDGI